MEKQYLVTNGKVTVVKLPDEALQKRVPPAVYALSHNEIGGYSLDHLYDKYDTPPKMYGSIKTRRDKIVGTFEDRDCSTGVMITGIKGAGKSELAKQTCNKAIKAGYPIVVISEPFVGTEFNMFIQDLGPCIIFYDEFTKIFNRDMEGKRTDSAGNQEQLLTLFDGSITGKRLVIITENSEYNINNFLLDRPGRMYYRFTYDKVEDAVVKGYIKDCLLPKKFAKEVLEYSRANTTFTMDILKALCEQKLRYDEPIEVLTEDMNMPTFGKAKLRLIIDQYKFTDPAYTLRDKVIENFNHKFNQDIVYLRPYGGIGGDDTGLREDYMTMEPCDIKYYDGKRIIYKDQYLTLVGTIVQGEAESKIDLDTLKAM